MNVRVFSLLFLMAMIPSFLSGWVILRWSMIIIISRCVSPILLYNILKG